MRNRHPQAAAISYESDGLERPAEEDERFVMTIGLCRPSGSGPDRLNLSVSTFLRLVAARLESSAFRVWNSESVGS